MAVSKKKPKTKSDYIPSSRDIRTGANPDSIYSCTPSWNFHLCDKSGSWGFTQNRLKDIFWERILPFLSNLENSTWEEILKAPGSPNHIVSVGNLNHCAQRRLEELHPNSDIDTLVSLRLGGTLRIYGVLDVSTLCILWYDDNHGDNDTCVYRAHQKYT